MAVEAVTAFLDHEVIRAPVGSSAGDVRLRMSPASNLAKRASALLTPADQATLQKKLERRQERCGKTLTDTVMELSITIWRNRQYRILSVMFLGAAMRVGSPLTKCETKAVSISGLGKSM